MLNYYLLIHPPLLGLLSPQSSWIWFWDAIDSKIRKRNGNSIYKTSLSNTKDLANECLGMCRTCSSSSSSASPTRPFCLLLCNFAFTYRLGKCSVNMSSCVRVLHPSPPPLTHCESKYMKVHKLRLKWVKNYDENFANARDKLLCALFARFSAAADTGKGSQSWRLLWRWRWESFQKRTNCVVTLEMSRVLLPFPCSFLSSPPIQGAAVVNHRMTWHQDAVTLHSRTLSATCQN